MSSNKINLQGEFDRVNDFAETKALGFVPYTELDSNVSGSSGASLVGLASLNIPAGQTLNRWFDHTQAAGYYGGGEFTDAGSGNLTVATGDGIIKATNEDDAPNLFFYWAADTITDLDEGTNYIYVVYHATTPYVSHATSMPADVRTNILLGKVFKEGTSLHLFKAGMFIPELGKNVLLRFVQTFGQISRTSGGVISETGTLNIACTDAVVWGGLSRMTTTGYDTSDGGTNTFEYYYYDGDLGTPAWVESDAYAIDSANYNAVATGLTAVANNRYGVHWVYIDADGHMMVVYGQASYKLADAQAAQPPASLPDHITQFAWLAAKIIVGKDAVVFTEIESAYDTQFTSQTAGVHNDLGGLQGGTADEYYHLTSAQYAGYNNSNWDSAYSHISADGSSHTFLDQSVVSGATPTFSATNFSDGGSNAIVTTTQETNWDNHIADNSQAHTDYMLNTGDTVTGNYVYNTGSALWAGTTGATPTSGAGTRMMWIPAKAAFRVGKVSGTQWNDGFIGNYSIGLGENVTANGTNSVAIGESMLASGANSVAIGKEGEASGASSVLIGNGEATHSNSISIGSGSAQANNATAIGSGATEASGGQSVAIGDSATASGTQAIGMGFGCEASGDTSFTFGYNSNATATASCAGGYDCDATGLGSVAIGNQNLAAGSYSVAFGNNSLSRQLGYNAYNSGKIRVTRDSNYRFGLHTLEVEADDEGTFGIDEVELDIPEDFAVFVTLKFVFKAADDAVAFAERRAFLKNIGGTTTLLAEQVVGTDYDPGGIIDTIEITANNSDDTMQIYFYSEYGEAVGCVCKVEVLENGWTAAPVST